VVQQDEDGIPDLEGHVVYGRREMSTIQGEVEYRMAIDIRIGTRRGVRE
jgi:hypothetical protein